MVFNLVDRSFELSGGAEQNVLRTREQKKEHERKIRTEKKVIEAKTIIT